MGGGGVEWTGVWVDGCVGGSVCRWVLGGWVLGGWVWVDGC